MKPFFHPTALVESDSIGAGTRIWAFAHVLPGAVVGRDCQICDHVFIEDGARVGDGVTIKNGVMVWKGVNLGDSVFVGPGVVFTNDPRPRSPRGPAGCVREENDRLVETRVEKGASIGANATILPGVRLGEYCMVAAGSVVTRDVPPFALVAGNPARIVGTVDEAGRKPPG